MTDGQQQEKLEQEKIASILSEVDFKITSLESKKTNLEKLKEGLMQKLLTGQIQVKVWTYFIKNNFNM